MEIVRVNRLKRTRTVPEHTGGRSQYAMVVAPGGQSSGTQPPAGATDAQYGGGTTLPVVVKVYGLIRSRLGVDADETCRGATRLCGG